MTTHFPADFLWGASTSAFQVEGAAEEDGKKKSAMDVLSQKTLFSNTSVASDHYHQFRHDVALMKELGLKAYRFSIAWSRVLPDGSGNVNQKGIDFYNGLIDELIDNQITPIATLYHYDLPFALVEKYDGWISRRSVEDFAQYSQLMFKTFGDRVKYWLTINEQSVIVQSWKRKNYIPEQYIANPQIKYQINHHLNLAHAMAVNLCHQLVPNGKIGPALGYDPVFPISSRPADILAAFNAQTLRNQMFLDVYVNGEYTKSAWNYLERNGLAPKVEDGDGVLLKSAKIDFLAINYYASIAAQAARKGAMRQETGVNLSGQKGGTSGYEIQPDFYEIIRNPMLDSTQWDWAVDPLGLQYVLRDVYERYQLPIIITENGFGAFDKLEDDGSVHDQYRIQYLHDHIEQCREAIKYGVELFGYCPWSCIDLMSTSNGYQKRYGFVYVNRDDRELKDLRRIKKDSYYWYQKVIASNGEDLDT